MRAPLVGVGIETLSVLCRGSGHRMRVRYNWRFGHRTRTGVRGSPPGLVLLGFDVALIFIAGERVHGAARVEPGRGVLQRQAHVHELLLDFLDRLGAEVADVEQVLLAAGDKLAHGVDALTLEAVVGPDRQVQVLDRQRQVLRKCGVTRRRAVLYSLGVDVELTGQAEQLGQRLAGAGHRVARTHALLGLDVQDEPVEVGALLNSGGLDLVGDAEHRRVDGVDRDPADLLARLLVLRRGDVATAALDRELHLQLALAVQRGDVQFRVVYLDTGGRRDVRRGNRARALLAQVHHDRLVVLGGDDQLLQVEDDVGDILLDPRHRGELVQHALDADRGDRRPRDGGQQGAPNRVADRVAEARLERLDRELGPVVTDLLLPKGGALCDEHDTFLLSGAPAI